MYTNIHVWKRATQSGTLQYFSTCTCLVYSMLESTNKEHIQCTCTYTGSYNFPSLFSVQFPMQLSSLYPTVPWSTVPWSTVHGLTPRVKVASGNIFKTIIASLPFSKGSTMASERGKTERKLLSRNENNTCNHAQLILMGKPHPLLHTSYQLLWVIISSDL